ncbi:maleylpyruvate isomerase N-terminal domain-containing protein [Micromonospora sp. NPDC023737]|uniref:maleylpyruvate isomerase N-terminal domain-containing protein n=1 Tax=unclassified Micromonospora TaxID=2617518 RepID=UPI0033F173E9
MTGGEVVRAAVEMVRVLGPHTETQWDVPASGLTWSCWTTAAHVAHDLLAYAGQVSARPTGGYLPFDLRVAPSANPREVLTVVTACAGLLAATIDTADPGTRAWHYGPCDPGGFAAMGVAETLLHTWDITTGLGLAWEPPADLSAAVIDRLFPEAPSGPPPQVLRWLTGRGELPGRVRRTSWSWRAALG